MTTSIKLSDLPRETKLVFALYISELKIKKKDEKRKTDKKFKPSKPKIKKPV